MSLSINYSGKKVNFKVQLEKYQLVLLGIAVVVGIGSAIHWMINPSKYPVEKVLHAQQTFVEEQHKVVALKQQTEQQLSAIMMKIGELQGQARRLNALGSRLTQMGGMDPKEFAFDQDPAMGGPIYQPVTEHLVDSTTMLSDMDSLIADFEDKERQLKALESILISHHIDDESYFFGRPIDSGWLSSYYGVRKDPFSGLPAMHKGIDFAGKEGDKVYATGAGIVTWSGERYGYGNLIEVDHGAGLKTRYGHNKTLHVAVGDVVVRGQAIAEMGNTGRSTGAHVHYEVLRHGKQIDPIRYVYRKPN